MYHKAHIQSRSVGLGCVHAQETGPELRAVRGQAHDGVAASEALHGCDKAHHAVAPVLPVIPQDARPENSPVALLPPTLMQNFPPPDPQTGRPDE